MAELVKPEKETKGAFQLELKCDLCQLNGDTVCVDCMECLCKTCLEIHSNNEIFKAHKTVTKDDLPENFTSGTLHELKDMIYCDIHYVLFEYYCEDHTEFVCQGCMRKSHRGCKRVTKISNVQLSPQAVLNDIQGARNEFTYEMKQRKELRELESAEMKRQVQLKATLLAKIQAFIDQGNIGIEEYDHGNDAVDKFCNDVESEVQLQDRHEELLRAVLHLNDTEWTNVVSRRIALSLEESPLKKCIESGTGRKKNVKKMSDRLAILEAVTDELLIASHSDDNDDCFNKITRLMKNTSSLDVDRVQTEIHPDIIKIRVAASQKDSSDINTDPETAVREARTFGDAEVQTEDAPATSSMTTQGPCTTEHITASADVETEPDDVTGLYTSKQPVAEHGCNYPFGLDATSKTEACTQQSATNIPLLQNRLEFIGDYDIRAAGEGHCNIVGISVLKDMRVALIDMRNDNLKIYDEHLNFEFLYKLKRKPIDICVVNYDSNSVHVAISYDSKRVEMFHISEDTLCYVRGFDLSMYCRGICSMSCNTIAVLVSDVPLVNEYGAFRYTNSYEDDMGIQIRDINNGRIITCIDSFDKEVRSPVFMIKDIQNNIIIGEDNQVSAFDSDGDRIWFYRGYRGSKLNDVQAMDIDPEGNIYVCSHESQSIHQVSSYNYKANRVIIPHVPSPGCVAYDPHQKRLIIGSHESKIVKVFRFV